MLSRMRSLAAEREHNINVLLIKIAAAMKSSKMNMSYALKFFDDKGTGRLHIEQLRKLFAWMKCNLDESEENDIIRFLGPDISNTIDYAQFVSLLEVASQNTVIRPFFVFFY